MVQAFTVEILAGMGKEELRQACRDLNISYAKLNNDGMRKLLENVVIPSTSKFFVQPVEDEVVEETVAEEAVEPVKMNGLGHFAAQVLGSAPVVEHKGASKKVTTGASKIEKNREERNGVKRPSAGGKCREVWDAMDDFVEKNGSNPTSVDVRLMAEANGWNPNNASIEFYQWRKFNGISGRATK